MARCWTKRTGEVGYRPVTRTLVTRPEALYHVGYDPDGEGPRPAETLSTTAEHPFYVAGRGFVAADNLEAGDDLYLADGATADVTGVQVEAAPVGEAFTAYNLSVGEFHTYFVGDAGVWVHNADVTRLCEQAFSTFEAARKAFPDDEVIWGFQDTLERMPNLPPVPKRAFVQEVVDDLARMADAGRLSQRLTDLAFDAAQGGPDYRELLVALRWEAKHGRQLRRPLLGESGDFVDVATGHQVDVKGPLGPQWNFDGPTGFLQSLKNHVATNPPGHPQSERLLVDLVGLDEVQARKVREYLAEAYDGYYEVLEDTL